METPFKLKELIALSTLDQGEQEEWYSVLSLAPEYSSTSILELFERDLKWIVWTYNNYKKKEMAFLSGDSRSIQNILKEEEKLLGEEALKNIR